ncbi:Plasma membrane t-SNARE, secretory vesicle fusion [Geranomyces variabilis]|nr:Plasma membrane t-SNARE, secretory vesicle fusion [Geranomyces variabilis]
MSRDRTQDLQMQSTNSRYSPSNTPPYNPSSRYQPSPANSYSSRQNSGGYNDDRQQYQQQQQQPAPRQYPPQNSYDSYNSYDNSASSRVTAPPPAAAASNRGGSSLDRFLDEVARNREGIERVNQNVAQIEKLHQKALLGTSTDEQQYYTQQVDALQDETSDLIQSLRASVKALAAGTKTAPKSDVPIRQKQSSTLAEQLVRAAQTYQSTQLKSKQKYRQRMEREIRVARPDATSDEISRALDSGAAGGAFAQQLLMSSRVGSQRQALAEVQTRHEEISRIEESVSELLELFQDMQNMLETQQETIDAIETHVETSHVAIEQGSSEMSQAIVHRKASRKKAWYIVACLIVLLIIIAIVIYIYVVKPALDAKNATAK